MKKYGIIPNPGSKEAQALGCICPVLDNCHGAGFPYGGDRSFYYNEECPVHNPNRDEEGLNHISQSEALDE